MDTDNLIRMANRIDQFFEAMPDRAEALDGIATHIQKFWAPPMRAEILSHLQSGGEGLMPLVAEAIRLRAEHLMPRAR